MKKALLLFAIILNTAFIAYSQSAPCYNDWGFWQNVNTPGANTNFRISFKLPASKREACQYIWYRFENLYSIPDAYLMFKVDYKGKDGTIFTNHFTYVKLDKTGVFTESGNWLPGYEVVRVYDGVYKELPGKKKTNANIIPQSSQDRTNKLLNDPSTSTPPSGHRAPDLGRRADNAQPGVENVALTNSNQTTQQVQYQNKANTYINAAQNSTGEINKTLNLNLAAINAQASGNKGLASEINQQIDNQTNESMATGVTSLFNLLTTEHKAKEVPEAPDPNDKGYAYYHIGDYKQALKWYKKAADEGNATAMLNIGLMYDKAQGVGNDDQTALSWYKLSAEKGNIFAMFNAAMIYYRGTGNVPQDYNQALIWYERAADGGYALSMFNTGYCYANGLGTYQDYSKAIYWYEKAANKGVGQAMGNLAYMYEYGKGVDKDYKIAMDWYKRAVEDDDEASTSAMYNLGAMYALGLATPVDQATAFKWFQRSAALGNDGAMYTLGDWYSVGRYVKKDIQQAVYWFRKAAIKKNDNAIQALKQLGY